MHGGAWLSGSKDLIANYLRVVAGGGCTVVGIGYSISPRATYPTHALQLLDALAYLTEHADELGVDAQRLVLAGDSAGAQIAAQVAGMVTSPPYAASIDAHPRISPDQIAGTVLFCGAFDMSLARGLRGRNRWFVDSVMRSFTGTLDYLDDPRFSGISVVEHLTADFPPTFVSCGNADPGLGHTLSLIATLERLGVPHETLLFDADHVPPLGHELPVPAGHRRRPGGPGGDPAVRRAAAVEACQPWRTDARCSTATTASDSRPGTMTASGASIHTMTAHSPSATTSRTVPVRSSPVRLAAVCTTVPHRAPGDQPAAARSDDDEQDGDQEDGRDPDPGAAGHPADADELQVEQEDQQQDGHADRHQPDASAGGREVLPERRDGVGPAVEVTADVGHPGGERGDGRDDREAEHRDAEADEERLAEQPEPSAAEQRLLVGPGAASSSGRVVASGTGPRAAESSSGSGVLMAPSLTRSWPPCGNRHQPLSPCVATPSTRYRWNTRKKSMTGTSARTAMAIWAP